MCVFYDVFVLVFDCKYAKYLIAGVLCQWAQQKMRIIYYELQQIYNIRHIIYTFSNK
jgi:hypothetical protein